MYLFFDKDGILKEQITTTPVRYGDSEGVNKIYVYWDDNPSAITNSWCILRKPNGDNTLPISYTMTTGNNDDEDSYVPYNPERDLKFFKYNTPYKFLVFDIPEDVFDEVSGIEIYSVLGSVYIVVNDNIKAMGLFAFAVEPSTLSVAADQNINIAQWNELVNMITGNPDYNNLNVQTITFKASGSASSSGLSMVDNVIYWKGTQIALASDLTSFITQSDLASYVTFSDLSDYAQKSDLENYVNLTSNQNINGEKSFLGALRSGPNGSITINRLSESEIATIQNIDNDNQKIDTYKIIMSVAANNQTYTLTLPEGTGSLALVSNIISYAESNLVYKGNVNQEINGTKKFTGTLQVEDGNFIINRMGTYSADGREIFEMHYTDATNFTSDTYGILVDATPSTRMIGLKLPTTSGTLALKSDIPVTDVVVNGNSVINNKVAQFNVPTKTSDLTNDSGFITDENVVKTNNTQTISGQKTFTNDVIIDNGKKLYIDNATIPATYSETTLITANVIDNENNGNEASWEINVGNIDVDGAEYKLFLPQANGDLALRSDISSALTPTYFTATSANEVVFDTTSRNCFKFEIGSNYNGIYVFTHSYLMMLVPIYGLTENQIYKFAGPGISDWTTGSVINSLYNMKRSGNYLYIWSGKSDYQLATGINGTLAKIKLY